MEKKTLEAFLAILVLTHSIIITLNVASFFIVPFLYPWYIFVPICTMIARVIFVQGSCPLTVLENIIRRRLGLKEIGGFVKHYLLGRCKCGYNNNDDSEG